MYAASWLLHALRQFFVTCGVPVSTWPQDTVGDTLLTEQARLNTKQARLN